MAIISNIQKLADTRAYQEFKIIVKRILGVPVIKLEMDDLQIDLAIYQAIKYYQRFHMDGNINLLIPVKLDRQVIQQGYVEFPESVLYINKVFDFSGFDTGLFSIDFMLAAEGYWEAFRSSGNMHNYVGTMQYLANVKDMIRNHPRFRFNYNSGRCYLDTSKEKLAENNWLLFDCNVAVDPCENHRMYEDPWLIKYAVECVKEQWGNVIKKYSETELPGGIKINGKEIWDEAVNRKKELEEELKKEYQLPPMMIIG